MTEYVPRKISIKKTRHEVSPGNPEPSITLTTEDLVFRQFGLEVRKHDDVFIFCGASEDRFGIYGSPAEMIYALQEAIDWIKEQTGVDTGVSVEDTAKQHLENAMEQYKGMMRGAEGLRRCLSEFDRYLDDGGKVGSLKPPQPQP